jgi:predicted N-acetyltransferase YhbS
MKIQIRPETEKDIAEIRKINTAAFDTEAEATIVDNLRKSSSCFRPSGFLPPFWLRARRKIRNQMRI